MLPSIFLAELFLVVVELAADEVPVAVDEDEDEVVELDVAFEPVDSPDGVLLASFANGLMARSEMVFPPTSVTFWVTLVLETEIIFPLLAFLIPLLIRSSAPGGTAGIVQLLAKVVLVMRDESQDGAVVVVFCALTP